jgi:hypothetical protein
VQQPPVAIQIGAAPFSRTQNAIVELNTLRGLHLAPYSKRKPLPPNIDSLTLDPHQEHIRTALVEVAAGLRHIETAIPLELVPYLSPSILQSLVLHGSNVTQSTFKRMIDRTWPALQQLSFAPSVVEMTFPHCPNLETLTIFTSLLELKTMNPIGKSLRDAFPALKTVRVVKSPKAEVTAPKFDALSASEDNLDRRCEELFGVSSQCVLIENHHRWTAFFDCSRDPNATLSGFKLFKTNFCKDIVLSNLADLDWTKIAKDTELLETIGEWLQTELEIGDDSSCCELFSPGTFFAVVAFICTASTTENRLLVRKFRSALKIMLRFPSLPFPALSEALCSFFFRNERSLSILWSWLKWSTSEVGHSSVLRSFHISFAHVFAARMEKIRPYLEEGISTEDQRFKLSIRFFVEFDAVSSLTEELLPLLVPMCFPPLPEVIEGDILALLRECQNRDYRIDDGLGVHEYVSRYITQPTPDVEEICLLAFNIFQHTANLMTYAWKDHITDPSLRIFSLLDVCRDSTQGKEALFRSLWEPFGKELSREKILPAVRLLEYTAIFKDNDLRRLGCDFSSQTLASCGLYAVEHQYGKLGLSVQRLEKLKSECCSALGVSSATEFTSFVRCWSDMFDSNKLVDFAHLDGEIYSMPSKAPLTALDAQGRTLLDVLIEYEPLATCKRPGLSNTLSPAQLTSARSVFRKLLDAHCFSFLKTDLLKFAWDIGTYSSSPSWLSHLSMLRFFIFIFWLIRLHSFPDEQGLRSFIRFYGHSAGIGSWRWHFTGNWCRSEGVARLFRRHQGTGSTH